jgi:hypothetical protein
MSLESRLTVANDFVELHTTLMAMRSHLRRIENPSQELLEVARQIDALVSTTIDPPFLTQALNIIELSLHIRDYNYRLSQLACQLFSRMLERHTDILSLQHLLTARAITRLLHDSPYKPFLNLDLVLLPRPLFAVKLQDEPSTT